MARLNNVNTTDIPDAVRLGCRTMSRIFDADDDDRPFFESRGVRIFSHSNSYAVRAFLGRFCI